MSGYVIFRAEDVPGQAEPVEGARVITVADVTELVTALTLSGIDRSLPLSSVRQAIMRFTEVRPEKPETMGSTAIAHCRCSYNANWPKPLFMLAPGGKWVAECGQHDWVTLFDFDEVGVR